MAFKKSYVNLIVGAQYSLSNISELPLKTSRVLRTLKEKETGGRTTGNYIDNPNEGRRYLQVALYSPILGIKYGYVYDKVTKLSIPSDSPIAEDKVESLLSDLIKNDVKLNDKLTKVAGGIVALKSRGVNVSKEEKLFGQVVYDLAYRQAKLRESGLLKVKKTYDSKLKVAYSNFGIGKSPEMNMIFRTNDEMLSFGQLYKNYVDKAPAEKFEDYLKQTLKNGKHRLNGIGEIALSIVIGISLLAGAGLAVAAYYAFRPEYDKSVANLKVSDDLQEAIDYLNKKYPGEGKGDALKADLENQVDKAYNQGKSNQKVDDIFGSMKWIFVAGLGFILVDKFLASRGKR